MNVRDLQQALRVLETTYAAGGAAKQAKEINDLVVALDGFADASVEAFAAAIADRMNVKNKTQAAPSESEASDASISRYVSQLLTAGTNRSAFEQAFAGLKADRTIRQAAMSEIANRYRNEPSGGQFKFKFDTKSAAIDFIFSTYMGRAEGESRLDVIGRMTKWTGT